MKAAWKVALLVAMTAVVMAEKKVGWKDTRMAEKTVVQKAVRKACLWAVKKVEMMAEM